MKTIPVMYENDRRIVLTLDAGGTNLVFSAIQGGRQIVPAVTLPAAADDLQACLGNLVGGFTQIRQSLSEEPVAISFAFPGPADYPAGVIGDLPNFPAFRGGVALGPFLEEKFRVPVFIHNDGNLFAYGEALAGALPEVNRRLEAAGSAKRFANLVGITLGTGFGAGVVVEGRLLTGDNSAGGDVWCLRNKKHPDWIVEESVSIRGVQHAYAALSGDAAPKSPKDIFEIAEGRSAGDPKAAAAAFAELGEMAGDAVAAAVTLVDGLVVIGGGLAGASKYILPAMIREMNSTISTRDGVRFSRLQMQAFRLDDDAQFEAFARGQSRRVAVPGTDRTVEYDPFKRIGVTVSRAGASRSIALGAYIYALNHL